MCPSLPCYIYVCLSQSTLLCLYLSKSTLLCLYLSQSLFLCLCVCSSHLLCLYLSQSTLISFCVCPSLLYLCMRTSLPCNVCLNVFASQLKMRVSTTSVQIRVCANSHSSRTQHAVFALPYGASFSLSSPFEATVIQSQRLMTYRDTPGCCSRQYWSCCCHLNTVWLHDLMVAGWCRCGFR